MPFLQILLRSNSSRGLQPRSRNFASEDIRNCRTRYCSLTVSNERKSEEVLAAKQLITDVSQGESSSFGTLQSGLDIISCPSCSRVENEAFVELAEKVKVEAMPIAERHNLTIAVMGCRVNGPGETDDANLGLWCGPTHVNLKKGSERLGAFTYEEIVPRMLAELNLLAREK